MQDLATYGRGVKADLSTLGRMREHKQQDYRPNVPQGNMRWNVVLRGKKLEYIFQHQKNRKKNFIIEVMTEHQDFLTMRKREHSTDAQRMPWDFTFWCH